jgi:long-subunit fatty acid transport protein
VISVGTELATDIEEDEMKPTTPRPFALIGLLLLSRSLHGQTNSEINSGIQFNFSSPGARSLSLGGAFVGLADDATAAYTNPAGLTNLSRPEISVEGRRFQYTSHFLTTGSANESPTCEPNQERCIDTIDHRVFTDSKSITNSFSYASLVYPVGNLALAFYWHELANFEAFSQTDGAFFTAGNGVRTRFFPVRASVDLRISSFGGSVAYRIGGQFSLGVGVSRFTYTQNTILTRFNNPQPVRCCHADYSPDNVLGVETATGDDTAVAVNAGFLWKPNRHFSIGGVYRQGPKFEAQATSIGPNPIDTTARFHVPDVFGFGVAVELFNAVTITADYDRVRYSQLTDGIVDTLNGQQHAVGYLLDDRNEGHLGVQWAIPFGKTVLALRAGTWYDPDHVLRYDLALPLDQALLFSGGKNVWHGSGGIGVAIGEHFQIDAAGDFSSTVNTASVSTVFRF